MVYLLLGIAGVGKSTVARLSGIRTVNFGDVMFEFAKERFGIEHRDEMRKKIPREAYLKLQEEAAKRIAELGDVLVDTHACVFLHDSGYLPGVPMKILEILKPKAIIVIEASPAEIAKRRAKDKHRIRDQPIEEELKLTRTFAIIYSAISGAPVYFVENKEGKAGEAAEKIKQIVNL